MADKIVYDHRYGSSIIDENCEKSILLYFLSDLVRGKLHQMYYKGKDAEQGPLTNQSMIDYVVNLIGDKDKTDEIIRRAQVQVF